MPDNPKTNTYLITHFERTYTTSIFTEFKRNPFPTNVIGPVKELDLRTDPDRLFYLAQEQADILGCPVRVTVTEETTLYPPGTKVVEEVKTDESQGRPESQESNEPNEEESGDKKSDQE